MASRKIPHRTVEKVLELPEIRALITELEKTRWTGRKGYAIRSMVGMVLVKSIYELHCWTDVVRLVREHRELRAVVGCAPSEWACYRFAGKLRAYKTVLDACIGDVLAALKKRKPEMGEVVAIDGSDLPAFANGQRFVSKNGRERKPEEYADPDASWGHRSAISTRKGGGFYGYKIHAAVDTVTGLPLAWTTQTASSAEANHALPLVDAVKARGFGLKAAVMDRGYDNGPIYDGCMDREVDPIISLRETASVQRGEADPPSCRHGQWVFAGADRKRRQTKWRCPEGKCSPGSRWIKANRLHPVVPRDSERFKSLYASRVAVERSFGHLKHEWSLLPLRVRHLERVRLHVDLTVLALLTTALIR